MEPFRVEQDSPLTAWGQVHRDLRRRIESGEFSPGTRIPSEAVLVAAYGVSRATVRRAIEALVSDGSLHSRRGSGTFVNVRKELLHCEVDLLRPWREQLLASDFVARSRLLEHLPLSEVPDDLSHHLEHDEPRPMSFGLHLQEVNGVAIAMTESWIPARALGADASRNGLVTATSSARVVFSAAHQARTLGTHHDSPLMEIVTGSRLRETGEIAELARTWWVADRVRFTYRRNLTVAHIDMSELLPRS